MPVSTSGLENLLAKEEKRQLQVLEIKNNNMKKEMAEIEKQHKIDINNEKIAFDEYIDKKNQELTRREKAVKSMEKEFIALEKTKYQLDIDAQKIKEDNRIVIKRTKEIDQMKGQYSESIKEAKMAKELYENKVLELR